jgi:hypothetical protein
MKNLSPEAKAQIHANLEKWKVVPLSLSETQIAKLKTLAPNDRLVWYRAGRQKNDGKTFVCAVTDGKTLWGKSRALIFAGTLESDGSFQPAVKIPGSTDEGLCIRAGFHPPVEPSSLF